MRALLVLAIALIAGVLATGFPVIASLNPANAMMTREDCRIISDFYGTSLDNGAHNVELLNMILRDLKAANHPLFDKVLGRIKISDSTHMIEMSKLLQRKC